NSDSELKKHEFIIRGINKERKASQVLVKYDINHNNAQVSGNETIEIPADGVFVFLKGNVEHMPDQYVSILFSDPLNKAQNMAGLIQLGEVDFDYEVVANEVKLYPTTRQIGSLEVKIDRSIKNADGEELEQDYTFNAIFEQVKPDVRWADDGIIIPNSEGAYLAFEAVALKEIDIEVVKIFNNNIGQFLQNNHLDGENEMKRVGRPVLRKTISLQQSGVANLMKWNRFNVDLTELTQQDPTAIYNVHISYRMHQAYFECDGDTMAQYEWQEKDWDQPSSYYYYGYNYYRYGYSYRERDNPCHISYYLYHGNGINKNVLTTDIGVIAKKGADNTLNFAVTQISTSNPINAAQINLYNLQQQLVKTVQTNDQGLVKLKPSQKVFMAEVSFNNQKTYLRLDNNSNLSLSHFNTSGAATKNGFKGFIYGERGVWRPGDSVFVTFMLQDQEKQLPEGHPIVFELEDPRGKTRVHMVQNSYADHVYAFKTKTDINAPTGMWLARCIVGDNVFTKSIPIETIKPNRLKIKVDFDKDAIRAAAPYVRGNLSAKWLHGAIAKNMDAKIEATMVPVATTFNKYEDFDFDDEAKRFESESKEIFSGKLDNNGNAQISADLSPSNAAPGKVLAKLKTTVTEHSGYSSIDMFDIPYFPYDNFVGVKIPKGRYGWLQTDTTHNLQLALVDYNGKPVKGQRTVQVELYKLNFRWWWDRSSDYLSNYVYNRYKKPVSNGSAVITNGKGAYNLKLERPNWGRHYLKITDPISGHSTGKIVYISWPWWAGSSDEMAGVSVLEFKSDKEDYNVGETASINIPATPKGRALVSRENGTKVIDQFWVETIEGSTNFNVEITDEMAPNVYVHVSQIQPHGNTSNDLPIRLYGIINLNVKNPESVLSPQIKMPEVLRPEQDYTIEISEQNGKEMTYTIAVVDEGLLDLTRFKTPQPWDHFYTKEALGVESFDIYKYVTGSTTGELSNILGIGGDLAANGGEESKLNRFKPCVKFLGPFHLKANGQAKHKINMPYYVGSVRTMVVARQGKAYGNAQNTTPVRT
ncbi:MAG: alpha-2-macroglobulin family protein, partial [Bacteroidia bacterium]